MNLGKARILGIVALIVLASLPALAFHEDGLPLVVQSTQPGHGWTSLSFSTGGAKFALDVTSSSWSGPLQAGAYVYDESDSLIFGITFTSFAIEDGILVKAGTPLGPVSITTLNESSGSGLFGVGLTFNDPQFGPPGFVGTFKVLLWVSGKTSDWSFAVRGTDVSILGEKKGNASYLFTSKDFESGINVHASLSPAGIPLAGARVNLDTSVTLDVENAFVGVFFPVLFSVDEMSVSGPQGDLSCPCFPYAPSGPASWGPGTYVFRETGVGAAAFPFTGLHDVILGGADASLP